MLPSYSAVAVQRLVDRTVCGVLCDDLKKPLTQTDIIDLQSADRWTKK
jgi:hypothetical protein